MKKIYCDVCNKEYEVEFDNYYFGSLDICPRCFKKIYKFIKELKKKK